MGSGLVTMKSRNIMTVHISSSPLLCQCRIKLNSDQFRIIDISLNNKTYPDYPELNMPKLTPYIPTKSHESMKMHAQSESSLGITFDGHASNISVHGINTLVFRNIE